MKNENIIFLCQCNNCGEYLKDENPQTDAIPVPSDILVNVVSMERINDFWGCPNCKTDGYLADLSKNQIKNILFDTGQKTKIRISINW